MDTLLLAVDTWDLVLDASGNIARAGIPYARAQDVSSAAQTYAGEVWYDTRQGIPYQTAILGQRPSLQFVANQIENAALTVAGVVRAKCILVSMRGRRLSGQIQLIDIEGASNNVQF